MKLIKNKPVTVLFIDTSKDKQLDVFLISANKIVGKQSLKGNYKVSENLLKLIDKLLKLNKITFRQLDAILVVPGPGPFTSIRIAIAVANTLAYILQIPVIGIEPIKDRKRLLQLVALMTKDLKNVHTSYLEPIYGSEPNITKPKK